MFNAEGTSAGTSNSGSQNQATEGITLAVATSPPAIPPAAPAGVDAESLRLYRDALVEANPQAVPELIAGSSFADMKASVETAKAAYARVAGVAVANQQGAQAPHVPAGGGSAADTSALPPVEKIKLGLEQRQKAQ